MTFTPDSAEAAQVRPSPNFGARAGGRLPDMLLLHYTDMPSAAVALERLCDPATQVSCHYLIYEDGRIVQLVREADRAWHAGASCWAGERDINSCSIGIELVNEGHRAGYPDFPDAQMDAAVALCADIVRRHQIAPCRVLAHSDVAPDRKIDPGEKFDWQRLARAGAGLWPEPQLARTRPVLVPADSGADVSALQRDLASIGYDVALTGVYDRRCELAVAAFQRHFRPALVDGRADPDTLAMVDAVTGACHALTDL